MLSHLIGSTMRMVRPLLLTGLPVSESIDTRGLHIVHSAIVLPLLVPDCKELVDPFPCANIIDSYMQSGLMLATIVTGVKVVKCLGNTLGYFTHAAF